VIQTWHPPASVNSDTPQRADQFMADVLNGRRLL
jgi:multiple sugar transport system substrate-binding protein